MYTFIEYPKCSTCRKAKSELDGLQCEFQSQNIVTETPTSQELQEWMAASGLPIKSFFNTSGMKYRELGLKDKVDQLTVKEAADLLASDGMLIKRPLLVKRRKSCSSGLPETVRRLRFVREKGSWAPFSFCSEDDIIIRVKSMKESQA